MDEFCGSTFWDLNVTWNTANPDFTPCFQKTVLVWVPCAFLWVFTFMEVSYILNSKDRHVPWSFFNISKLLVTTLLIILTIVDLTIAIDSSAEYNVEYYTPVIKMLSFCLSGILLYLNKKYGLQTSGLLFLFWLLLAICGLPQFRSEIIREVDRTDQEADVFPFISYMIYYPLVLIMLILNSFADSPPRDTAYSVPKNPCPEAQSSFLSRILYSWFDKLAWTGYRRPIVTDDLWSLNPENSSMEVVPLFDKYWNKSFQKKQVPKFNTTGRNPENKEPGKIKSKNQASILPALWKAFGRTFIFGSFLKLAQDLIMFVSPQILSALIAFVAGDDYVWKGYMYAFLLFIAASLQSFFFSQYFQRMYVVALRIRTSLISAIYRKALRLSNSARKESTVGEIVNLMSVDAQKFMDLTPYLNMVWSGPLQIGLSLYFLWGILGPSVLAGLGVMIILFPISGFIATRFEKVLTSQMKNKDERVKTMSEVLAGIKVLKLNAWEPSFEDQILNIRDKEMRSLKQAAYLNAAASFVWSCAPFLVSLVTFATFVLSDPNNVLDAQTAFVSLSLFNILRFPLSVLPMIISYIVQTAVSVRRINKFMNADELDLSSIDHDQSEANPILIENGTFSWGSDEPIIKNVNFSIPPGSLVAVVGTVGSGKSSLLSALLGEMEKHSGRVNMYGSVAYVAQQAWIQNCTLQDNVLFGKNNDKIKYDSIIEACALNPDLEILPGGDQTEIGEKGINLSGGQKQRVSLARAVYCDSDIYLLDDPLSAVDSHVGKHIFDQVIGPEGLLKKKTRVLVTHGITYLHEVDNIIVLKDGEVSDIGTYAELMEKKGAFAEFLMFHLNASTGEKDIEELKEQLEESLGPKEFLNKMERVRTQSESTSEKQINEELNSSGLRKRTSSKLNDPNREKNEEMIVPKEAVLIEEEKTEVGFVKWEVYWHYLSNIGLAVATTCLVMNIIFQAFSVGSNIWLVVWSSDSDESDSNQTDTKKRDMYLGIYGALGVGQAITSFFTDLTPQLGCWLAAKMMHNIMLKNVMKLPLTFFDTTPLGRILSRFSKDVNVVDTALPMEFSYCIYAFFEVLSTLVVISISTPIFLSAIIPIAIVYYFIQRFFISTSRQLKRLESITNSPIYSHFGESLTGAPTIRAYGTQERFIKESEAKVDFNQVCYYPSLIGDRWLSLRLTLIGNIIILLSAVFAVLSKDSINPGLVGLSVNYALQITQMLNMLVELTAQLETDIVAVERMKEYSEITQEAPWTIDSTHPGPDWPTKGGVIIDKLVMKYRPTLEPVLHGISCEVFAGEKVGIVGRTGAGKSTLTLALFRLVEAFGGRILIDGVDISKLGLHALRSRLTIIPQDPVLFSGSLRINLDPFSTFSDDDIWRALEHAHLKTYVEGLSAGLNHVVNEGGENLSVGQRQLLCLARALLRKTNILILDEATAAVDLETDDLIQVTIRKEFSSCTVLTIAHRLNTIMDSNRVLVLDKGKLAEFDTPDNLLQNKNSIFYSMAKDSGLIS